MASSDLNKLISRFKDDLRKQSPAHVVAKHVITGPCFGLGADKDFELRCEIAEYLSVSIRDVIVVGSGKLGFSINPTKPLYRAFGSSSDIDVAVVSGALFEKIWKDLYDYAQTPDPWLLFEDFKTYLFQGWIRPDKMPPDSHYPFGKEWWEFFNRISASRRFGINTIRAGVYRSMWFLEKYQQEAVLNCRSKLDVK